MQTQSRDYIHLVVRKACFALTQGFVRVTGRNDILSYQQEADWLATVALFNNTFH